MSTAEMSGSLGLKAVLNQLNSFLQKQGVDRSTRETITSVSAMMYEYIPYAIRQGKNPADKTVLIGFLQTKGLNIVKLFGHNGVNCAIAISEFVLSVGKAKSVTATGFPPAITLAWGLAMLDLIEVGNSCEPVQQLTYELFMRESHVKLAPVRVRAKQCIPEQKDVVLKLL